MLHKNYDTELKKYNELITKKNSKSNFYNGIFDRYENPVLTREHIPLIWKFDLNPETNPYFMERLGVNAVMNSGAIELNGKFYLVPRIEGNDRKSFFGVAESDNGVDGFRFWDYPIQLEDTCKEETNVYDMRLTKHEDGYVYGVFCTESKDTTVNDLSAAVAAAGIVRTKDLKTWERLDNLKTLQSPQQRNVVLHPEFVDGKYAFYTRPMDDFIDTGSGGGIGFGTCEDIKHAVIKEEIITSQRKYHTITEAKNGAGAVPIKTNRGWIHIAHGVRNTAAGLRYVLYAFATDLEEPTKVIAEPSGLFLAPRATERVGDVSNVVFTNGAIARENGDVFIYYASCDTRMHVATTTIDKLVDYVFNTPIDPQRTVECVAQRCDLITANLKYLNNCNLIEPDNEFLQYSGRIDFSNKKRPILIYPCSSIKLKFTGSTLKIKLINKNIYWNNYLGIIIDGKQEKVLLTNEREEIITLADNLEEKEHTAIIFKRMDSCHAIHLLGFYINTNEKLLKCEDKPNRKIEFYGDSVSAGEVSEAVDYVGKTDPVHNGEYSNSWYSYAWITARKLNAQIHNVAQGGIALLNNTGWFYEPNYIGLESTFDKISYHPDLGDINNWDFKDYVPQVIVIAIGQNDNHPLDYMKEDYNCNQAKYWREHYERFAKGIREMNPKAFIILTTTILEHHVNWDNSIEEVCSKLGDKKIVHFLYSNNGCGTPGHIRIPEAEKMADELTKFIHTFGEEIWN